MELSDARCAASRGAQLQGTSAYVFYYSQKKTLNYVSSKHLPLAYVVYDRDKLKPT
jgi:hypothetical protein